MAIQYQLTRISARIGARISARIGARIGARIMVLSPANGSNAGVYSLRELNADRLSSIRKLDTVILSVFPANRRIDC
jgi:hypothetical protein